MNKAQLLESLLRGPLRLMPPDEPVFLLRAQDELAVETVEDWASRAADAGVTKEKVRGALDDAERMNLWPVKKLPD